MARRIFFLLAIFALSLSANACLDDTPVAPKTRDVRLGLRAQIIGQAAFYRIEITVSYLLEQGGLVQLPSAPAEVIVQPATTTSHDVSVEIGACLRDPLRQQREEGGCILNIELRLLDESGTVLSEDSQEVFATGSEGSIEAPPFVLSSTQLIVVIDDSNIFDNRALNTAGNVALALNLAIMPTGGVRGSETVVQLDCGRAGQGVGDNSEFCTFDMSNFKQVMQAAGLTVRQTASTSGSLSSVPGDVRMLILLTPCQAYTATEVNAISSFISEGGRLVLLGDWTDHYGLCRSVENGLLQNLGAATRSVNGAHECDQTTQSVQSGSIRNHLLMTGVQSLTVFCASSLQLGSSDVPLFSDRTNAFVIGTLAVVDLSGRSFAASSEPTPTLQPAPGTITAARRDGPSRRDR